MTLDIPQRWDLETEDHALYKKYYHATLFQQFGDIPQVRYIVEYNRMRGSVIITPKIAIQMVAKSAALYFLFPGPDNQQAFETTRNLLRSIIEQEERWG